VFPCPFNETLASISPSLECELALRFASATEGGGINRLQEALCVSAHTLGTHALAERIKPRLACSMMRIMLTLSSCCSVKSQPWARGHSRGARRQPTQEPTTEAQASLAHGSRTAQTTHGCLLGHNKCLLSYDTDILG